MNILVVDDEAEQLDSLRVGLKSRGFKVFEALNAEDALKRLSHGPEKIDIVITDYAMPGMNGMELLKKLRKKNNMLPVILMTAYGKKNLIIDALHNNCNSFIEKPFTLDQLLKEIDRVIFFMLQNIDSRQLNGLIPKLVHQINNHLFCISGNVELGIHNSDDTEAIKKHFSNIIEATKKIQHINRKVLEVGRKVEDKIETVEIRGLLHDCIKTFEELMALKGVSMEKDLNSQNLYVSGNRFELEQLFENLILNSIDSMDGRPEKRLRITAGLDQFTSSASVSIEDTGCGIMNESMDKIFTSYFTDKNKGTGLGLSVVKDIVEKHKGEIKVKSQVDKGTTFKVGFPAVSRESTQTGGEKMDDLAETMDQAVKVMKDREGKYLTFSLANEEYGIGILKIKEIIGMMPITTVPQTPEFVKGVINLRGKVIPVIDLRLRFGMDKADYTERTCIIVVELQSHAADILIGIVVDSVSEVLNIKADDIEDTPTFGTKLNIGYILGMAKMEGGVKILLDIAQVLSSEEVAALEKAA